jgi:hypothetical protein
MRREFLDAGVPLIYIIFEVVAPQQKALLARKEPLPWVRRKK